MGISYALRVAPGTPGTGYELGWQALSPERQTAPVTLASLPTLMLADVWSAFLNEHERAAPRLCRSQLQSEVLLPYLRARRWLGDLSHTAIAVEVREEQEWRTALGSWLLTVLDVHLPEGEPQRCFLPLAVVWAEHGDLPAEHVGAHALAHVRERARVGVLYDAFADPGFCRALLLAMADGEALPLGSGRVCFDAKVDRAALMQAVTHAARLPERERRNTGVFFGDSLHLKGYRCLQAGVNPEAELGHFLERAGFAEHIGVVGAADYVDAAGTRAALLLARPSFEQRGNAWEYTLAHLVRRCDPERHFRGDAVENEAEHRYQSHMTALGRRLGELHTALACDANDAAFSPQPITHEDATSWRAQVMADLADVLDRLQGGRAMLSGQTGALADAVLAARTPLGEVLAGLDLDPQGLSKTRHHADLQLAQVLLLGDGQVLIDFESEAFCEVAARREKHVPLRDVASVLGSLDHAARVVDMHARQQWPEQAAACSGTLRAWQQRSVRNLLEAYYAVLPPAAGTAGFVALFEFARLLDELRHALAHRPDDLRLPLAALAERAAGHEPQADATEPSPCDV